MKQHALTKHSVRVTTVIPAQKHHTSQTYRTEGNPILITLSMAFTSTLHNRPAYCKITLGAISLLLPFGFISRLMSALFHHRYHPSPLLLFVKIELSLTLNIALMCGTLFFYLHFIIIPALFEKIVTIMYVFYL